MGWASGDASASAQGPAPTAAELFLLSLSWLHWGGHGAEEEQTKIKPEC